MPTLGASLVLISTLADAQLPLTTLLSLLLYSSLLFVFFLCVRSSFQYCTTDFFLSFVCAFVIQSIGGGGAEEQDGLSCYTNTEREIPSLRTNTAWRNVESKIKKVGNNFSFGVQENRWIVQNAEWCDKMNIIVDSRLTIQPLIRGIDCNTYRWTTTPTNAQRALKRKQWCEYIRCGSRLLDFVVVAE